MKKILTITALGALVLSSNAHASGFHIKEQSVSALGNAFAGATAGAEDISYSYFNPAGLTRHSGTNISVGTTYIAPNAKGKDAKSVNMAGVGGTDENTGKTGDIIRDAPVPNFYISRKLDNDIILALSMNAPFGMITKNKDDWAGRRHGTMSQVKTITATPMVAYKIDDKMSFGAGLQMQYIKARLRNAQYVPTGPGTGFEDKVALEGDTFDLGYTLGALYEYSERTRIGLGYRSRIKQKLKGDIEFSTASAMMNQNISAELVTPAILSVGIYHEIDEKWAVMGEFQRAYWSAFDELRIKGSGQRPINSLTQEEWKDTNFYSIGASYKVDEAWKLRFGLAYDDGAVGRDHRTPRIPDSSRVWYSVGAEYKHNDNLAFNAGYTYISARNAKVDLDGSRPGDVGRGGTKVDYKAYVHILGLGMNYNF